MSQSTIRLVGNLRQPQHDSYGRKVPIWEVTEVATRPSREHEANDQTTWRSWLARILLKSNDERRRHSIEKQPSWKSWASRSSSWGSSKSKIENKIHASTATSLPLPAHDSSKPHSWRPQTLQLPVLGSVFVATLLLIVSLEVLSHISNGSDNRNGGGIAFATGPDGPSKIVLFSYLYLPTIIAVIYSMVWSWIDLDTKRLEPWFQLSKPNGATAEHSLLLQYPFDFVALVPIRAARRRHWSVFIAGSTMVFITWAIVPLQSAIFTTGKAVRTRHIPMEMAGVLMDSVSQTISLNAKFLNAAYGVSWLGQRPPPFVTKEFALMPFQPLNMSAVDALTETWSGETQMFYTNLTCSPAKVSRAGDGITTGGSAWNFDDENGCFVPEMSIAGAVASKDDHIVYYIPYWNDAQVDRALANPNCTRDENKHKFLAVWAEQVQNETEYTRFGNIRALFCEPAYYTRTVTATVNASTSAVVGVTYDSRIAPNVLTEDVFNATNFEYLVGTGVTPQAQLQIGDMPDTTVVQQYPRLVNYSLAYPVSHMVGYGIAASSVDPKGLANPVELSSAFHRAHQLLFATAINQLTVTNGKQPWSLNSTFVGTKQDEPESIIYVRAFAIIVEACLGVVAALTCVLWIYYKKRPSSMVSDPGSISDVMKLVQSSQNLLHDFHDNGTVTNKALNDRLKGHRFQLVSTVKNGYSQMKLVASGSGTSHGTFDVKRNQTNIDCPGQYKAVRPFELTYTIGATTALILAGAIATLIWLYCRIIAHNGIERPSSNKIVLTMLTNLVPTAFATLIEPFWVVLNRLLCILQPFDDLRAGNAKPDSTVKARYTSLPPQLAVWRALKSKHFLLAAVCAVAMSTNILAVTLSGLLEESSTRILIPSATNPLFQPVLNGIPDIRKGTGLGYTFNYLDHYYAAIANLSGVAPLPPWVDNRFYYSPFKLEAALEDKNSETKTSGYFATTRGYGVDIDCRPLLKEAAGNEDTLQFSTNNSGSTIRLAVSHILSDGTNVTCASYNHGNSTELNTNKWSNGTNAWEIVTPMTLANETSHVRLDADAGYCRQMWVLGWVRVGPVASQLTGGVDLTNSSNGRSFDAYFMKCTPRFRTAMFNVSVDTSGRVVASDRTTEFDIDFNAFGEEQAVRELMVQTTILSSPTTAKYESWHNTTYTSDWANSALVKLLNSTELIDPTLPLLNITTLIPRVEDLYRRLSAMIMSFDSKLLLPAEDGATIPVTILATQTRIFMEPVMFYISISLLGLQIAVLLALYAFRPRRFLPRMPLTIASIIAYVSASHATQDLDPECLDNHVRYAYGRFRGVDGYTRVGIEVASLVVPLKSDNPEFKRRRLRWLSREQDPAQPKIWI